VGRARLIAIVLTLVLALAIGTAIGRYVVPNDSKGTSAECMILKNTISDVKYVQSGNSSEQTFYRNLVTRYDNECR
jgi:hypothetical protein